MSTSSTSSRKTSLSARSISTTTTTTTTTTRDSHVFTAIRPKPLPVYTKTSWKITNETTLQKDSSEFQFDHVFQPTETNWMVYNKICAPLVTKFIDGSNVTLFAYGTTGAGKTYTMEGTKQDPGLLQLSVSSLFQKIPLIDHNITVSYLEIYNEKVFDLLNYPAELHVREDSKLGTQIAGITKKDCANEPDLLQWIQMGNKNRKIANTQHNKRSSRSHAIALITLGHRNSISDGWTYNTFSFCDLAGSESVTSQSNRRTEGSYINKSLLALGTVVSKLSSKSPQQHVPYRDSKLTRLLQPALSGNGVITTICAIDMSNDAATETMNTLRFAARARHVSLHVVKKAASPTTNSQSQLMIEKLLKQIEDQKKVITKLSEQDFNRGSHDSEITMLRAENKVLHYKLDNYEKLLDKDLIELQDTEFLEIIEMLPGEVGTLLETKLQGLESELRQHKEYIFEIETQVESLTLQNATISIDLAQKFKNVERNLQKSITNRDAEIRELRKNLERKDRIIDVLQCTKKLRETTIN